MKVAASIPFSKRVAQQLRRGFWHDVSVGINDIDYGSRRAQCIGNHIAGNFSAGNKKSQTLKASLRG